MFDLKIARAVSSFGAWNFGNQAAESLRAAADPIILNKLCGAAAAVQVTCFYLGNLVFYHIATLAHLARGPLTPVLTALHATGDDSRIGHAYVRGNRYGLWTSLLAGVPLMIFAHEFFMLYTGPKYIRAAVVMTILLAQYPFVFTSLLLPSIAEARNELRGLTLISIGRNVVNVVLSIYLVGFAGLGAVGAALAGLITAVGSQAFYMPLGIRLSGISWRRWWRETVLLGCAPAVAAVPAWLAARYVLRPTSWIELAGAFAIGAFVYVVVLLVFCLQPHERRDLRLLAERVGLRRPAQSAA